MALTKISTGMLKADAASVDLNIDAGTLFLDVANNRVGIANTSPSTPLHVIAASPELRLQDSDDNGYLSLNHNGGNSYFSTTQGGILFRTGNTTERMRITSAGNVGIGTSAPERSLHVKSAATIVSAKFETVNTAGHLLTLTSAATGASHAGAYNGFRFYNGDGFNMAITHITESSGDGYMQIGNAWTGGNQALVVHSGGNVGIGTTAPSSFSGDGNNLVVGTTSGNNGISIISATDGTGNLYFGDTQTTGGGSRRGQLIYDHATDSMRFATAVTERMRIDSSGNVGIGTSAIDGTLHLDSGTSTDIIIEKDNAGSGTLRFHNDGSQVSYIQLDASEDMVHYAGSGVNQIFYAGGAERMRIDSSGYVGIGTTSPSNLLDVTGSVAGDYAAAFENTNSTNGYGVLAKTAHTGTSAYAFGAYGGSNALMVVRGDGNVGIGTTSPAYNLQIDDASSAVLQLKDLSNSGSASVFFADSAQNTPGFIQYNNAGNYFRFGTNGNERVRLNSSGNLLVGATTTTNLSDGTGNDGVQLNPSGTVAAARTSNVTAVFNRLSTDGEIVRFNKDGTTVGSIGSNSGTYLFIASANNVGGIGFYNNSLRPVQSNGNVSDADQSLGISNARWKDLYLSGVAYVGAVVSTSTIRAPSGTAGAAAFNSSNDIDTGIYFPAANTLAITTNGAEKLRVDVNGNFLVGGTNTIPGAGNTATGISLYNDGRIFASKSSNTTLSLNRNTSNGNILEFRRDGTTVGSISATDANYIGVGAGSVYLGFYTDGANNKSIIPMGNGVGQAATAIDLGINNTNHKFKDLYLSGQTIVNGGATSAPSYSFAGDTNTGISRPTSDAVNIVTGGSERLRVDGSGNLLLGTTTAAPQNFSSGSGTQISDGYIAAARGAAVALLNRVSTDGDLVEFKKNGSIIGKIGSALGDSSVSTLFIADAGNVGIRFDQASTDDIQPCSSSGADRDAAINLGASDNRFKDLFMAGAVKGGNGSASAPTFSFGNTTTMGMYRGAANQLAFSTNSTERLRINASGNVGIGLNNPSTRLHTDVTGGDNELRVATTTSGDPSISFYANGAGAHQIAFDRSDLALTFTTVGSSERMRIDSSGNVAIGNTSAAAKLDIRQDSGTAIRCEDGSSGYFVVQHGGSVGIGTSSPARDLHIESSNPRFRIADSDGGYAEISGNGGHVSIQADPGNSQIGSRIDFEIDGDQKARLDLSGNLLVGTTTTDGGYDESDGGASTVFMGASIGGAANGSAFVSRRAAPLQLNRQANDGDIAVFRKNGTTVGSIGTASGYVSIGTSDTAILFNSGADSIRPWNTSTNAGRDSAIDLGSSGNRFKDLFLSGRANLSNGSYVTFGDISTAIYGSNSLNLLTFTTNSSEKMRLDGSGNLLISKTSNDNSTAGVVLRDTGEGSFVASGQRSGLFRRLSSDGDIIEFRNASTTVGSISTLNGMLAIGNDNVFLNIDGGSGDYIYPMSSASGGASNGVVTLGFSSRRFKDLYLSGGVYLGGTGSANHLDDYEEGTWTPALEASTTNPTLASLTIHNATYTKVGRIVHVQAYITANITNVGAGGAQITGLPFTVGTGYVPVFFTHGTLILSSGGYFNSGSTKIIAIQNNSLSSIGYSGTGASSLMISGIYEVS